MSKLGKLQAPKKVSKLVGYKGNTGFKPPTKLYIPTGKKIGVLTTPKIKPLQAVRLPNAQGSGVTFALPGYGQANNQQGLTPNQVNNLLNPGGINPFSPVSLGYGIGSTVATGDTEGLEVFPGLGSLIENLNDPSTYITIVGYVIAIFLILIALYGIVTNAQKSVASSVIGQNTKGLYDFVKPSKPKGKGK